MGGMPDAPASTVSASIGTRLSLSRHQACRPGLWARAVARASAPIQSLWGTPDYLESGTALDVSGTSAARAGRIAGPRSAPLAPPHTLIEPRPSFLGNQECPHS